MVWPGSHRDVYTSHEKRFDFSARAKFLNVFRQHNVKAPFELTGSAGDVLFFHHRLFHSGSNNFGDTIRFGILNDFIPSNFDEIRGGTPTAENMWDYWSPAVQKIAADLADVSPLTRPGSQPVRAFLLRAFRAFRRLKGSYADEYEEKYARAKARSDDG